MPGVLRQGKLIDAGNAAEVTIVALEMILRSFPGLPASFTILDTRQTKPHERERRDDSAHGMNEKREQMQNSLDRLVIRSACRLLALRNRAVHRRIEASHRTPNG